MLIRESLLADLMSLCALLFSSLLHGSLCSDESTNPDRTVKSCELGQHQ